MPLKASVLSFVVIIAQLQALCWPLHFKADRTETAPGIVETAHTGAGETRTALMLSD